MCLLELLWSLFSLKVAENQIQQYKWINVTWSIVVIGRKITSCNEPFAVSRFSRPVLRHPRLYLWNKHMPTGRINQVAVLVWITGNKIWQERYMQLILFYFNTGSFGHLSCRGPYFFLQLHESWWPDEQISGHSRRNVHVYGRISA
jgi:hypothetical protein